MARHNRVTPPLGLILSGGLSRRMGGGEKGLLQLGGITLVDRAIARLSPQVGGLAISANGAPDEYARFGLPVLPDTLDGRLGPLAGILSGLTWAQAQGASHIVSVAADTPFFPTDLVARLSAAKSAQDCIALAASPDPERGLSRHPTFGLWPVTLRADLEAALKDGLRKVVAWTDPHGCALAEFSAEPFDPFFNVNTPQDMAQAEALLLEVDR